MPSDPAPASPCYSDPPVFHTEPEQTTIAEDWPDHHLDPDGSPSLDPKETTPTDPDLIPTALQTDEDRALSRSFRHSGWAPQRQRTARALDAAGFPTSRLDRFNACGCSAFVLTTLGPDPVYRIASNRCHDRFCVPCSHEKRRVVAANLQRSLPEQPLRLITLTLRGSDSRLAGVLHRLRAGFTRLRSQLSRGGLLVGGVAFLEITRNDRTGRWHPHLHVICQGKYIAQSWLRDLWMKITGDSFIVDIRLIRGPAEAAAYVLKYASKALSPKVWSNHDALTEAIRALSGKRTFNCFGTWAGFDLSRVPQSDLSWVFLDTLPNLLRRYTSGEKAAGAILRALTNRGFDDPPPSDLYDFP